MVNRALDQKVDEAQGLYVHDSTEEKCAYCGQGELDLCSPFVVGQCRTEHEAQLSLCKPTTADRFFPDKTGTAVKFCIYGEVSRDTVYGIRPTAHLRLERLELL